MKQDSKNSNLFQGILTFHELDALLENCVSEENWNPRLFENLLALSLIRELLRWIVRPFIKRNRQISREEWANEAMGGFVMILAECQHPPPVPFRKYVVKELRKHLENNVRYPEIERMRRHKIVSWDNNMLAEIVAADKDEVTIREEKLEMLREVAKEMGPLCQLVISMLSDGKSYSDIADALDNYSYSQIRRVVERIGNEARKRWEKANG